MKLSRKCFRVNELMTGQIVKSETCTIENAFHYRKTQKETPLPVVLFFFTLIL